MDACSATSSHLGTFFLDNICRRKRWPVDLAVTHLWACTVEMGWDRAVEGAPSQTAAVNLQEVWQRQGIIAYPKLVALGHFPQECVPGKLCLLLLVNSLKDIRGYVFQRHDLVSQPLQ